MSRDWYKQQQRHNQSISTSLGNAIRSVNKLLTTDFDNLDVRDLPELQNILARLKTMQKRYK